MVREFFLKHNFDISLEYGTLFVPFYKNNWYISGVKLCENEIINTSYHCYTSKKIVPLYVDRSAYFALFILFLFL